jgi:hypothetical protein
MGYAERSHSVSGRSEHFLGSIEVACTEKISAGSCESPCLGSCLDFIKEAHTVIIATPRGIAPG